MHFTGGEGRSHNNTDVAHIFWSDQNSAYLVVLRAGSHGNKSVPTIKMIVVIVVLLLLLFSQASASFRWSFWLTHGSNHYIFGQNISHMDKNAGLFHKKKHASKVGYGYYSLVWTTQSDKTFKIIHAKLNVYYLSGCVPGLSDICIPNYIMRFFLEQR